MPLLEKLPVSWTTPWLQYDWLQMHSNAICDDIKLIHHSQILASRLDMGEEVQRFQGDGQ